MKIKGVYGNDGDKQIQFDGETHEEGCIRKLWVSKDVGSWRMYIPNTCGHAKSSSNDDDPYSQMNHQKIINFW